MKVFDITTYGAVGDDSTDNTSAITAAIDAASTYGGAVYIPYGTFRSGQISLKSNVSIFGDGWGSCLKLKNSGDNFLLASTDATDYLDDIVIRNLRIDGNKANNTTSGGILLNGRRNAVHHCYIHDTTASAIQSGAPSNGGTDTPLAGDLLIHDNICMNPGTLGMIRFRGHLGWRRMRRGVHDGSTPT
jgi:polygalacturonase